jgi:hypothetical protein
METLFSNAFVASLKMHATLKNAVKKQLDMIIENPIALGEPIKGNFRGFYSVQVIKRFLIIYLYCKNCRNKGDNVIVLCNDCRTTADDTIKFIALGPHDQSSKR